MRTFIRCAIGAALVGLFIITAAPAVEKVHEKPSAFLTRHFGSVPKTQVLALTKDDKKQLASILGHPYAQQKVRYWTKGGKTAWILDEVGKTKPITTGIIIRNGKISEVKVLIYRESHGWEVSRPFFTKQFVGASLKGGRLSKSVDGVVGATLSVRALTKLSTVALYLSQQSAKPSP